MVAFRIEPSAHNLRNLITWHRHVTKTYSGHYSCNIKHTSGPERLALELEYPSHAQSGRRAASVWLTIRRGKMKVSLEMSNKNDEAAIT